tara:strand:+ start:1492 stop:1635 length:144 start_codon:yes stop_codon:yes gene_type:complete
MKNKKVTQLQRIARVEKLLVQTLMKITELDNIIKELQIKEVEQLNNK